MKITDVYEDVKAPKLAQYKGKLDCVNQGLIIGFELETEGCNEHTTRGWSETVAPFNFTVTQDGSLRGIAYEFLSKPMRSTHALAALTDFFAATKFDEANYSDRCSIHVHANCTDLELEQVSCLALLYSVLEDILFEFVGRDRDTNIFCVPWNQCRLHLNLVQRFLEDPRNTLRQWNKYTALNMIPLNSLGTVEFRQMYGTADMVKITKWVNIIGAMFKYAKEVPLNVLIDQIKSLNNTSQYEAFFNQVLGGQLPYNDLYRQRMEEGVILAKFSLMSRNKPKKKLSGLWDIPDDGVPAAPVRNRDEWAAILDRQLREIQVNYGDQANGLIAVNPFDNAVLGREGLQVARAAPRPRNRPGHLVPAPAPAPRVNAWVAMEDNFDEPDFEREDD